MRTKRVLLQEDILGKILDLFMMFCLKQKKQNIPGMILSIDFEKAFDTVSWKFIEKVLKYFNFGPSIISWIKLFQNGSESCIIQNGFISNFFKIKKRMSTGRSNFTIYFYFMCRNLRTNVTQ